MFHGDKARTRAAKYQIDRAIHDMFELAQKRSVSGCFHEALASVRSLSGLLRPQRNGSLPWWNRAERCLRALLALSGHGRDWIRSPSDWRPGGSGDFEQFGSLACHLLATSPLPQFMTLVWFEEPGARARQHQKLFKHLGRGHSIRGAATPISVSREMASFFDVAPDHLSVEQALRWSQLRTMGGNETLALAVAATSLGEKFDHDAFWVPVIRALIAHPPGAALAGPMIGFLEFHGYGSETQPPLTFEEIRALVPDVLEWDRRERAIRNHSWRPLPIGGLRYAEPRQTEWSSKLWTIREITDRAELEREGRQLRHCVGTFADACERRETSIWSLQRHGALSSQRVLTIEVDPKSRQIIAARGKWNSGPRADARRVMEMWARKENLTIGPSV